jgi:hypothetical protein
MAIKYRQEIPIKFIFVDPATFCRHLSLAIVDWLTIEEIPFKFFIDDIYSMSNDSMTEFYVLEFDNAEDMINFKLVWL